MKKFETKRCYSNRYSKMYPLDTISINGVPFHFFAVADTHNEVYDTATIPLNAIKQFDNQFLIIESREGLEKWKA